MKFPTAEGAQKALWDHSVKATASDTVSLAVVPFSLQRTPLTWLYNRKGSCDGSCSTFDVQRSNLIITEVNNFISFSGPCCRRRCMFSL